MSNNSMMKKMMKEIEKKADKSFKRRSLVAKNKGAEKILSDFFKSVDSITNLQFTNRVKWCETLILYTDTMMKEINLIDDKSNVTINWNLQSSVDTSQIDIMDFLKEGDAASKNESITIDSICISFSDEYLLLNPSSTKEIVVDMAWFLMKEID